MLFDAFDASVKRGTVVRTQNVITPTIYAGQRQKK